MCKTIFFYFLTAVTLQFVSHSFLDYHDPTIEDSYQQQAIIDGEAALLDILGNKKILILL